MASLLHPATADSIRARIDRLRPETRARWGKMNAQQMVCHLTDAFKVALSDTPPSRIKQSFLSTRLGRWLVISVMPWPKGKVPTTRDFLATRPEVWESDVRNLKLEMERFITRARDPRASLQPHPAFGSMSGAQYSRLNARHMDYHLKQFGV